MNYRVTRWFFAAVMMSGLVTLVSLSGAGFAADRKPANLIFGEEAATVIHGNFHTARLYLQHDGQALLSSGEPGDQLEYRFQLPATGYYEIYLWMPHLKARASADIRLPGDSGTLRITNDLAGGWQSLGVISSHRGQQHSLRVTAVTGQFPADAVRARYIGPRPERLEAGRNGLALGRAGRAYDTALPVTGGQPPYHFTLTNALPAGLSLDPRSGRITGTAHVGGEYLLGVQVTDQRGVSRQFEYRLIIEADASASSPATFKSATLAAPPVQGAALPDLLGIVSAMDAGNWERVNLNQFSDVWTPAELRPLKGLSNPDPSSIIGAWSSFAWDGNRGHLLIFGGGHANYSGNDVYLWNANTRLWQRASLPSEISQDEHGNYMAIDGHDAAPASAHTYDNTVFAPIADRLIVFGGAAYNNGGAFKRPLNADTSRATGPYFFDPARSNADKVGGTTGSHVKREGPHPEVTGGQMWENRDIFDPAAGYNDLPKTFVNGVSDTAVENGKDVIYIGGRLGGTGQSLLKYTIHDINDPSQDTWEKVGKYWSITSRQGTGAYDPDLNIFVRTGRDNDRPFYFWDLNQAGSGNRDQFFFAADPTGDFEMSQYQGMEHDPVRQQFLLWGGGGEIWALKPPASVSTSGWKLTRQPAPTSAIPDADVGRGVLGKWKYIPQLDAFMALQDNDQGNIWLYKPIGWQFPDGDFNQPPAVEITEPASGQIYNAGDTVTIMADASDSDGNIALVEFFADGIKLGQDASPPFGLTWTDPGAGGHSLTAIATDNDGARSTSAPVDITVIDAGNLDLQDGNAGYDGTEDLYLNAYFPDRNYDAKEELVDRNSQYHTLLRFRIFQSEGGPIPDGASIISATLSLYKYSSYSTDYQLVRVLRDWSVNGATWNERLPGVAWQQPGAEGGSDVSDIADAFASAGWSAQWVDFDVTLAVQDIAAGADNRGWRLKPTKLKGNRRQFRSSDYLADPSLRPRLNIEFSTNP